MNTVKLKAPEGADPTGVWVGGGFCPADSETGVIEVPSGSEGALVKFGYKVVLDDPAPDAPQDDATH